MSHWEYIIEYFYVKWVDGKGNIVNEYSECWVGEL